MSSKADIMALRDMVRRTFEQGSSPAIVPASSLDRVLNEREALLKFAKRMDQTLDTSLYQSERAECAAAIAKAESP